MSTEFRKLQNRKYKIIQKLEKIDKERAELIAELRAVGLQMDALSYEGDNETHENEKSKGKK